MWKFGLLVAAAYRRHVGVEDWRKSQLRGAHEPETRRSKDVQKRGEMRIAAFSQLVALKTYHRSGGLLVPTYNADTSTRVTEKKRTLALVRPHTSNTKVITRF